MNKLHRFDVLTAWYEEHLTVRGYRPRTVEDYLRELSLFRHWLTTATTTEDIDEIAAKTLHGYTSSLFDRGLSTAGISRKLAALKSFFRALYDEGKMYVDLRQYLHQPRVVRKLPAHILTEQEVRTALEWAQHHTPAVPITDIKAARALRDHAVFEIAYGSGLRRSEIIALDLADINYTGRLVHIHQGKGGKSRVVPLGRMGVNTVRRYVAHARPVLHPKSTHLFLTCRGKPLDTHTVRTCIQQLLRSAGIHRPTTLHGLRHACATHMLNHGADIRYVQELLGHADLSTTQVYTHVSIRKLKQTHAKHHPREQADF